MSSLPFVVAGVGLFAAPVILLGPKKTVLSLMELFKRFRRFWLWMKNSSEQKETERYVTSGQAWENYCDTLKAAGATLLAPGAPNTPFDQAEGVRYLTRLIRASLTAFVECKDFDRPKFTAVANGFVQAPVKLGSDNPDNLYENALISSRKAYILTVKRNTVDFLGFYSTSGVYGQSGGLKTISSFEASEAKQQDGMIEILIAPLNFNDSENFLKLEAEIEDAAVLVRQTFKDRTKESAALLSIKKIGDFDYEEKTNKIGEFKATKDSITSDVDPNDLFSSKDKLTCEHMVNGLNTSGLFVAGASAMFAKWAYDFQNHVNKLPLFDVDRSNNVGGDPTIRYYHSYWKLADDEALIIKVIPPKVFTWNFQVNNHWMESLDYRYFRIHVNMASARYQKDGSVIVILTLKNPKEIVKDESIIYNWLSTTGHNQGTMCWRWTKPDSFDNLPQPQTIVCKFTEISKHV